MAATGPTCAKGAFIIHIPDRNNFPYFRVSIIGFENNIIIDTEYDIYGIPRNLRAEIRNHHSLILSQKNLEGGNEMSF